MAVRFMSMTVLLCFGGFLWGANVREVPDFNGVWHLKPSLSELHSRISPELTLQIEQGDGTIHLVQRTQDKKGGDDIRCATDGKDCKVKEEGRSALVSFYYNGPVLVELDSNGQNRDTVTKKRLHLSDDGSTLTIEVVHISPPGKMPEKLVLSKDSSGGNR